MSSYPQTFDLSGTSATARNPQDSKGQAIRGPLPSVTNAVKNPHLLSLAEGGWEDVQNRGGPTTEAGHSQTTTTTTTTTSATGAAVVGSGGINDANSGVHSDFSGPKIQALHAGLASKAHTTGDATKSSAIYVNADGMSVSSMGTSDYKTDESSYGTANAPFVAHEVSHMVNWADDNLNNLKQE